jgi:ATP-dependent DNA helicase RecG
LCIIGNAVVHKDYSTGNPIQIRIYDDKVVIYNDCQIPPNIKPESLLEGIGSRPHNPLIAGAFFRSGQIEARGRGIEKMKKGCMDDGLPEPEFKILPNVFTISFRIRDNNKEQTGIDSKTTFLVRENVTDIYRINVSDKKSGVRRAKLLEYLRVDGTVTVAKLAMAFEVSERTILRDFESLRNQSLIKRMGSDTSGYWVVI